LESLTGGAECFFVCTWDELRFSDWTTLVLGVVVGVVNIALCESVGGKKKSELRPTLRIKKARAVNRAKLELLATRYIFYWTAVLQIVQSICLFKKK
jgi:hypothetical protein